MIKTNNKINVIRSFTRREGRLTLGQRIACETLWQHYGIDEKNGIIDFDQIFNRHAATLLEIGFGNGDTLLAMAKAQPQWNFIGIEVYRPGLGALLANLKKQQLTNVRVFHADALDVLKNNIPNQSLSAVHLFFPDPWPKRPHHKRRLVQKEFCLLVAEKLQKEGYFHIATDWEDYAVHMQKVIAALPIFQIVPAIQARPLTKFEKRGRNLGHEVYDFVLKKLGLSQIIG